MLTPKRHHSGKRRAELLRGSIRERSSMKLKPSWQVGRKARSWINKNGECVFWVRGFKSRECAEEYQADLFETISRSEGSDGFHDYAGCGPRKHMAIDCMVHRYAIAAMNPRNPSNPEEITVFPGARFDNSEVPRLRAASPIPQEINPGSVRAPAKRCPRKGWERFSILERVPLPFETRRIARSGGPTS